jgi:hypothetical protein
MFASPLPYLMTKDEKAILNEVSEQYGMQRLG